MAVTKKEVAKVWPQRSRIGAKLVIDIDDIEVINTTVWTKFNPAIGPTVRVEKQLQIQLQRAVDAYKDQKANYDRPGYDAALVRIKDGLEV